MAARSLDAILAELDASYAPQRQSIQTRLDALPAQADAEIGGLKATQEQAFTDILGGARDRGMGFSGVPLAEQSRYTASTFLPAVARVRQSQNETKQSLFDALNNVNLQKTQYGQSLYQNELDREEQIRQFNANLAAQREAERRAAAAQASVYGSLFGPQNQQPVVNNRPSLDSIFGASPVLNSSSKLGSDFLKRFGGMKAIAAPNTGNLGVFGGVDPRTGKIVGVR